MKITKLPGIFTYDIFNNHWSMLGDFRQAIFAALSGNFHSITQRLLRSDFHSISQRLLWALILKKAPINAKNSMPARDGPWGGLQWAGWPEIDMVGARKI